MKDPTTNWRTFRFLILREAWDVSQNSTSSSFIVSYVRSCVSPDMVNWPRGVPLSVCHSRKSDSSAVKDSTTSGNTVNTHDVMRKSPLPPTQIAPVKTIKDRVFRVVTCKSKVNYHKTIWNCKLFYSFIQFSNSLKMTELRPTFVHSRHTCTLLILCLCGFFFDAGDSRSLGHQAIRQPRNADATPTLPPPFPSSVTTQAPTEGGCFEQVRINYTRTVWDEDAWEERNVTEELVTRKCCPGWEGTECDKRINPVVIDPENPCANLTCDDNPNAQCAVVKKCGRNLPIFFDETGGLAVCKNGQPVDTDLLKCSGVCRENPCEGQRCPAEPQAYCFSINTGCECRAVWLLPFNGAEVDCETGEEVPTEMSKSKRQAGDESSACS